MHLNREVSISSRNPDPAPPPQEATKTVLNHKHTPADAILSESTLGGLFIVYRTSLRKACSVLIVIARISSPTSPRVTPFARIAVSSAKKTQSSPRSNSRKSESGRPSSGSTSRQHRPSPSARAMEAFPRSGSRGNRGNRRSARRGE